MIPNMNYLLNQTLLANFSANAFKNAIAAQYSLLNSKASLIQSMKNEFGSTNKFLLSEQGKLEFQQTSTNSKPDMPSSGKPKTNSTVTNDELGIEYEEERKFQCKHKGCGLAFKTKRQCIMHHNKFEPECKVDRNAIVKVIGKYKILLKKLVKQFGISPEKLEGNAKYNELLKKFHELKSVLVDPEYFAFAVGDKLIEDQV
jgi:hypothetical protein